jgi:hypothetical protein
VITVKTKAQLHEVITTPLPKGILNWNFELATKNDRIAALEAEVARLEKKGKQKAILNPNVGGESGLEARTAADAAY